jgi:hypothetical protein
MKEKASKNSRGLHYDPLSLNKEHHASFSKTIKENSSALTKEQNRWMEDVDDNDDDDDDDDDIEDEEDENEDVNSNS